MNRLLLARFSQSRDKRSKDCQQPTQLEIISLLLSTTVLFYDYFWIIVINHLWTSCLKKKLVYSLPLLVSFLSLIRLVKLTLTGPKRLTSNLITLSSSGSISL